MIVLKRFFAPLFVILSLLAMVSAGAAEQTDVAWVDVRSWAEHQVDHIEGDTRIHYSEILAGISELHPDKSTPIKLYCAAGGRAGKALTALEAAGYTNVVNAGGIEQVRAARGLSKSQ